MAFLLLRPRFVYKISLKALTLVNIFSSFVRASALCSLSVHSLFVLSSFSVRSQFVRSWKLRAAASVAVIFSEFARSLLNFRCSERSESGQIAAMWISSTFFNNIQPQKEKNRQGAGKDRAEIIKKRQCSGCSGAAAFCFVLCFMPLSSSLLQFRLKPFQILPQSVQCAVQPRR